MHPYCIRVIRIATNPTRLVLTYSHHLFNSAMEHRPFVDGLLISVYVMIMFHWHLNLWEAVMFRACDRSFVSYSQRGISESGHRFYVGNVKPCGQATLIIHSWICMVCLPTYLPPQKKIRPQRNANNIDTSAKTRRLAWKSSWADTCGWCPHWIPNLWWNYSEIMGIDMMGLNQQKWLDNHQKPWESNGDMIR